jgi:Protein of unknown function (DUF998)
MRPSTQQKLIKILLVCGILLFPLYIGVDTISALLYEGYNYTNQAISELSAIGAPTRWLWVIFGFIFQPLTTLLGIGVRLSAGDRRNLRIAGTAMIIGGMIGFAWLLFPMNMRSAEKSATDIMHLVMGGISSLLFLAYIILGSGAKGKWFRLYSILTILIMLCFGVLFSVQAPRVAANLPTPWMGIEERISIFSPILWLSVLAAALFGEQKSAKKGRSGPFRPLSSRPI